jgi:SAM-dependent methyltransferase
MHQSSLACMAHFVAEHLSARVDDELLIVDVGSADVNGTYRALFAAERWTYIGCDLEPMGNVDRVLSGPYSPLPFADESVDVVVSGQVLEHVAFPWVVAAEWARVLRRGGLLCVIVPGSGPEHRHPIDCYRFLPEGLAALVHWAGLQIVELGRSDLDGWSDNSSEWQDSMVVAARGWAPIPIDSPLSMQRAARLDNRPVTPLRTSIRAVQHMAPPERDRAADLGRAAEVWGESARKRVSSDADARRAVRAEWVSHPLIEAWVEGRSGGPFTPWVAESVGGVGGRMVSMGSGAATCELDLLDAGVIDSLVLVDIAEGALEVAASAASARGLRDRVDLVVDAVTPASVGRLVAGADIVFACDSLHHVADLAAVIAALRVHLRAGGVFLGRDYVGPDRFAFDGAVVDRARALYRTMPVEFRSQWSELPLPDPAMVARFDPTEAVEPSVLRRALHESFPGVELLEVGGALVHALWYGLDHDAMHERDDAGLVLAELLALDARLTDDGTVPSYFARFRAVA